MKRKVYVVIGINDHDRMVRFTRDQARAYSKSWACSKIVEGTLTYSLPAPAKKAAIRKRSKS